MSEEIGCLIILSTRLTYVKLSVQWNFTGWIVGWHKGTGQLVERFATEGGKFG